MIKSSRVYPIENKGIPEKMAMSLFSLIIRHEKKGLIGIDSILYGNVSITALSTTISKKLKNRISEFKSLPEPMRFEVSIKLDSHLRLYMTKKTR